jgi:histidine kinase/DNA gyrase B/HSP90-like ATPase
MPKSTARMLTLRPADPFDLIRWLARSQSDPRKAVAELVQNSIDAQARHVLVERRRVRGAPALLVKDDGEGVLPSLSRDDALRYIASHIGSSRKRNLSAEQRRKLVVSGQYGVGLLGFWSIGRRLEMRSRVARSSVHVLRLTEDEPKVSLDELPPELSAPETFTEIVMTGLHESASRVVSGRRLADYLAAELRGPILASGVQVEVRDALARGLAQRRFPVAPKPFTGEPLRVPVEVPVEGFPSGRVELYLSRGAERPAVQLSCAGTLVADDFAELGALELDVPPWVGRELSGIVEFPGFTVPPGTRRGVVPNAAADAFVAAMRALAPAVEEELRRFDRERRAAADRQTVDELRKALRGLRTRLPQYDLAPVPGGRGDAEGEGRGAPELPGDAAAEAAESGEGGAEQAQAQPELFAPGPLASVRIVPDPVEVAPGREHRVRAEARDAEGRRIAEGVGFRWSVERAGFEVRGEGPRPAVVADGALRPGTTGRLRVEAERDGCAVSAEATLEVVEPRIDETGLGIPEPHLVDAPGETWRSRFDGARWDVNQMHEDYLALKGEPKSRIRYLVALLAKDLAQHAHRVPGAVEASEDVAAILALVERNLRGV